MSQKEKKGNTRFAPWVRILALAMSILVAGGALTYLILFLTELF